MSPTSETNAIRIALHPVRPEDEEFLFEVYASTRAPELAATGWSEEQRQSFLRAQFQAQDKHYRENYPAAELNVIHVESGRAGRLYVHRRTKEIRIMDLALLPAFRGRGVGTTLLKQVLAEGQRLGTSVTVHVEMFNPALRWYERLGFRKVGVNGPYCLMEQSANSGTQPAPAAQKLVA